MLRIKRQLIIRVIAVNVFYCKLLIFMNVEAYKTYSQTSITDLRINTHNA